MSKKLRGSPDAVAAARKVTAGAGQASGLTQAASGHAGKRSKRSPKRPATESPATGPPADKTPEQPGPRHIVGKILRARLLCSRSHLAIRTPRPDAPPQSPTRGSTTTPVVTPANRQRLPRIIPLDPPAGGETLGEDANKADEGKPSPFDLATKFRGSLCRFAGVTTGVVALRPVGL